MPSPTLALSGLFLLGTAGVFARTGSLLHKRWVPPDASFSWTMFVLWWLGVASMTGILAVRNLAAAFSLASANLAATLEYTALAVFAFALWCLTTYLLNLFTGDTELTVATGAAYLFYYVALIYPLTTDPLGVAVHRWSIDVSMQQALPPSLMAAYALLFVVPPLLAAAAYGSFLLSERDRTVRYRIAMVTAGIVLWAFSTLFLLQPMGLAGDGSEALLHGGLLLSALLVLLAFEPPQVLQRRYRLEPVLAP